MALIDTSKLAVVERRPGWRGRYFDSPSMTFGHYEFDAGSSIHPHFHPQEEVWQIIEGELEMIIGVDKLRLSAGDSVYLDSLQKHAYRSLAKGPCTAIVVTTASSA